MGFRTDVPGSEAHLIFNAAEGELLFRSEADKEDLRRRWHHARKSASVQISAASFLDTHGHAQARRGEERHSLGKFMQHVFGAYCRAFNQRHGRRGHHLRGVYASIELLTPQHSMNVFRYVLLNPVKAGMISVDQLESYPWTSFPEAVGASRERLISRNAALGKFGDDPAAAVVRMRSWVKDGLRSDSWYADVDDTLRRHGLSQFVPPLDLDTALPRIIARVCTRLGCAEKIFSGDRSREVTDARCLVVFLAIQELGLGHNECAKRLGIPQGSIGGLRKRGARLVKEFPKLLRIPFEESAPLLEPEPPVVGLA